MKKGILASALAGGALLTILLLSGDSSICPEECPGKSCQPVGDFCLVIGPDEKPVRMNADAEITIRPEDILEEKRMRPLICCVEENEQVVWLPINQLPQHCAQIIPPGLFGGISMSNVDLGHAKQLNLACCQRIDGPVRPGSWGVCPYCAFKCVAGRPVSDVGGCDEFCAQSEEVP